MLWAGYCTIPCRKKTREAGRAWLNAPVLKNRRPCKKAVRGFESHVSLSVRDKGVDKHVFIG